MAMPIDTLAVNKKLKLDVKFGPHDVKLFWSKLIICLDDKIITVDKNLEKPTEIKLLELFVDKKNRKPKHDSSGRKAYVG